MLPTYFYVVLKKLTMLFNNFILTIAYPIFFSSNYCSSYRELAHPFSPYKMSRLALYDCYLPLIRPLFEYGDLIVYNCCQNDKITLENIQYNAFLVITGCK